MYVWCLYKHTYKYIDNNNMQPSKDELNLYVQMRKDTR